MVLYLPRSRARMRPAGAGVAVRVVRASSGGRGGWETVIPSSYHGPRDWHGFLAFLEQRVVKGERGKVTLFSNLLILTAPGRCSMSPPHSFLRWLRQWWNRPLSAARPARSGRPRRPRCRPVLEQL